MVIEHNLEVIKCADLILDLGPEGGDRGGEVVASGTPEELAKIDHSHTGRWLRTVLPGHEGARTANRETEVGRPTAPTGSRKKMATKPGTVAKTKKTGSRKKPVAKKTKAAKPATGRKTVTAAKKATSKKAPSKKKTRKKAARKSTTR